MKPVACPRTVVVAALVALSSGGISLGSGVPASASAAAGEADGQPRDASVPVSAARPPNPLAAPLPSPSRTPPPDTLGPPRSPPLSRAAQAASWGSKGVPAAGPAEAIGGYAAGCVRGAVKLPEKPVAYCFSHPERKRWFGHPVLISFVQRLAASAGRKKLGPLLVGDLSQARGGPAPTGHRSHQSGLDVDFGYVAAEPMEKGSSQAKNTSPGHVGPEVVDLAHEKLTRLWSRHVRELVLLAASDPAVDRLFVHPLIKRELCRKRPEEAAWLTKVRPWWGHQDHFHVRLRCPAGSLACENQHPIESDGCGEELEHWFKKKLPVKPSPPPLHPEPPPPRRDELVLPPACQAVLESVLPPVPESVPESREGGREAVREAVHEAVPSPTRE